MENNKPGKFYVDWWNIKKSTVYSVVGVALLLGIIFGGGWWLWKNEGIVPNPEPEGPKDSAQIISFEGDVRIVKAATRETLLVTKPVFVAAGDTIQTQADGRAKIQMIDGSILYVRPNSTVVIRDSTSLFGGTNVRVALDEGELNVRTQDQVGDAENVVEVKESENKVLAQTDASFNINEKTNQGEIRISRGSVETTIGGQKTVIKENEFASVDKGKITSKEKLITPPSLSSPESGNQILSSAGGSADITFRWQKTGGVDARSFQLQVAKSPQFLPDSMILVRDSLSGQSLSFGDISPGTYYWRVRANTSSGQVSDWSEAAKFTVIRRSSGGEINAGDWGVENLGGRIFIISGKTIPGTTVRSMGRETFSKGDGSFRLQISSPTSQVGISISDDKGNLTRYILSLETARARKQ